MSIKVETGTFSINTSSATILLSDDTLNIKGIYFQISTNSTTTAEESTGFTDGARNRAKSTLVSSSLKESKRSNVYCITHYKDVSGTATRKVAAKIPSGGLSTPGEFVIDSDNYDATISIDYMVVGD